MVGATPLYVAAPIVQLLINVLVQTPVTLMLNMCDSSIKKSHRGSSLNYALQWHTLPHSFEDSEMLFLRPVRDSSVTRLRNLSTL